MSEKLHYKLYKDLYYKIKSGYYHAGDTLPTEMELCEAYRVSRTTVRTALEKLKQNNLISRAKKRGSIVLPLQGERYFLNRVDLVVAVVFSYFDNYNINILNGLKAYAQSKNCYVAFYNSDHNISQEREILTSLLDQQIAGLILMPISPFFNLDVLSQFEIKKIPTVFFDFPVIGSNAPCVTSNNFRAAYDLTNYLIHRNHSNIAFYPYSTEMFPTEQERLRGFCKALTDNNIALNENALIYGQKNRLLRDREVPTHPFLQETDKAKRAIEWILSLKDRPSAIICNNDYSAMYIIDACKELGIRVPEQLAVTGFDDTEISRRYSLTTVSQNWGALSQNALELLYNMITGKYLPRVPNVEAYLVERSSVIRREQMEPINI